MIYQITHITEYNYSTPASLSQNELFLCPRQTPYQRIVDSKLKIVPDPQYRHNRIDYFGNSAEVFMIQHPHSKLSVSATSIVETSSPVALDPGLTLSWENAVQRLATHNLQIEREAYQFIFASPIVTISPEVLAYAKVSFPPGTPLLTGALHLTQRIFNEFSYDKAASTVDTTVDQVLADKKGVCQDFAHLQISCLRSLGLAARYVSGYLETIAPPGKTKLVGADASHAWVSIFIPDFGWVDLDPTNNQMASEQYITLAWGRDYGDVAPVKGVVMGGGIHQLSVTVDVHQQKVAV